MPIILAFEIPIWGNNSIYVLPSVPLCVKLRAYSAPLHPSILSIGFSNCIKNDAMSQHLSRTVELKKPRLILLGLGFLTPVNKKVRKQKSD